MILELDLTSSHKIENEDALKVESNVVEREYKR